MRIVDPNDVPSPIGGRNEYPWGEIKEAIDTGRAVEMDPAEYPTVKNAASLRSTLYAYAYRNGLKWQVRIRDGVVYVTQRQP